jgi:hypothetical protein
MFVNGLYTLITLNNKESLRVFTIFLLLCRSEVWQGLLVAEYGGGSAWGNQANCDVSEDLARSGRAVA